MKKRSLGKQRSQMAMMKGLEILHDTFMSKKFMLEPDYLCICPSCGNGKLKTVQLWSGIKGGILREVKNANIGECSRCGNLAAMSNLCEKDKKVLISHYGDFSHGLVHSIASDTERSMQRAGDSPATIRKMFCILIEGLQNIKIHGEAEPEGTKGSFLIIVYDRTYYQIKFGNFIRSANIQALRLELDKLNRLNFNDLKRKYLNALTNGVISEKGGAGLGLITMIKKSGNKLNYQFKKVNAKLAYFTLEVTLRRR